MRIIRIVVVLGMASVLGGVAFAQKPGKSGKPPAAYGNQHDDHDRSHAYFTDGRVDKVRGYYAKSKKKSGRCPPGLARKENGCRPPGQAKQWQVGVPLPPDVIYYDAPGALVRELGRTPEGQKLVRVGTDLLLITVGTRMVIDAIQDLDDLF